MSFQELRERKESPKDRLRSILLAIAKAFEELNAQIDSLLGEALARKERGEPIQDILEKKKQLLINQTQLIKGLPNTCAEVLAEIGSDDLRGLIASRIADLAKEADAALLRIENGSSVGVVLHECEESIYDPSKLDKLVMLL